MATQHNLPINKPTHRLYRVEGEGKTSRWTEIGAAWPNKDGNGFSITCEAMPISGRIVMRKIAERSSEKEAA